MNKIQQNQMEIEKRHLKKHMELCEIKRGKFVEKKKKTIRTRILRKYARALFEEIFDNVLTQPSERFRNLDKLNFLSLSRYK